MLLPALQMAKENGRRASCASNLRQLMVALELYDQDYGELPPGRWNVPNYFHRNTHTLLRKAYNVSEKLVTCPSAARWVHNLFLWMNESNEAGRMTYFYFGGNGQRPDCDPPSPSCGTIDGWLHPNFEHATIWYYPAVSLRTARLPLHRQIVLFDAAYHPIANPHSQSPQRSNHIRPNGLAAGANVVFADGHAEWHPMITGRSWCFFSGSNPYLMWTPDEPIPSGASLWP